jgi:hypothetical protein
VEKRDRRALDRDPSVKFNEGGHDYGRTDCNDKGTPTSGNYA